MYTDNMGNELRDVITHSLHTTMNVAALSTEERKLNERLERRISDTAASSSVQIDENTDFSLEGHYTWSSQPCLHCTPRPAESSQICRSWNE